MSFRSVNTVRLMQFDLSRRDRRQALGSHDSREFYEFGLPALVDKRAREGRLSVEISNDSVLFLGISGWQSDWEPSSDSEMALMLKCSCRTSRHP